MQEKSNNKVLIYLDEKLLSPKGGPLGYNYNLKQEIDKQINKTSIEFIKTGREEIEKWKGRVNSISNPKIRDMVTVLKKCYKHYMVLYGKKHNSVVNLEEYNIVHFHSTLDLYNCRDSLRSFRGKVILTSHSPVLLSKEIYDGASWFERNIFSFVYKNLKKMDEYAFERADYIFFPCVEAEEPYYHSWPQFKEFKTNNRDKFRYLLTGIEEPKVKQSSEDIRNKYGIHQNAFLIAFVGRHNEIKGYDRLKKIGEKFLSIHKDAYIIIAGKEEPMKGLHDDRWIELGWTNDPYSVMSSVNVLLLPNRETYFDLIMLEALALGKIVIASETGGNRFFAGENAGGVLLFKDDKECLDILERIYQLSDDERLGLETKSRELFERKFTVSLFAENYIRLLNSLE